MAPRPAPCCGLAPRCLWLLGLVLLMDTSARPANHSSARDRGGRREDSEILPPDHLNGVKLEMDGHLNKDFHQEVFLGKDTDGFEEDAEPRKSRKKLMVIFSKVDVNGDRRISAKEMQRWIVEKTAEHFQEAVEESKAHFRAVDPDGDGRVSWEEYKVKFLVSKGHSEREVAEKIKNNQELKVDEERLMPSSPDRRVCFSEAPLPTDAVSASCALAGGGVCDSLGDVPVTLPSSALRPPGPLLPPWTRALLFPAGPLPSAAACLLGQDSS